MILWSLLHGCATPDGSPAADGDSDLEAPDPTDREDPTDSDPLTDTDTSGSDTDVPVLTVDGGFGGGAWPPGATVHVWADVDPQAAIVTGWTATDWTGEGDLLVEPSSWNSPLVMPDHDATLTPTITAVTLAPGEDRSYALPGGDRRVLVVPTPSPQAGVVFLHGAAYSVEELNDNAARTTVMHMARAGWAVAALASEREAAFGVGGWDAALDPANTDLRNVEAVIAALRADGTFPAEGPVFAWGMSSGAIFAHTVGAAGLVDGVAAFCAAATPAAAAITTAPTAWYLAAVDSVIPGAADDALAHEKVLAGRQVPTDRYVHPSTPLYDARFTRIAGIDAAMSAEIADRLRSAGVVDADDRWVVAGADVPLPPIPGLDEGQNTAVRAEVEIMAADHELYDDVAARLVAFLAARIP